VRSILGTLALLALAGTLAGAADGPVLRIGMDTRTPPWSFVPGVDYTKEDFEVAPAPLSDAQAKKLTGVDVANALARRLGVTLKIVPASWFHLEEDLLAKRYDAIIGSWTPSRKTPATVVASSPYYEWGLLIAVRSDNSAVRSYADLTRVKVGHYKDPAIELTLRSLGAANLVARDAPELLFDDLQQGTLAAVVFDSVYVRWRVASDKRFRAVGEPLNRLGYHVGVRKDDGALYERVQKAVEDFTASPESAEIRKRWEGTP
jgi:polar amino acid transport system substrate-binding protein